MLPTLLISIIALFAVGAVLILYAPLFQASMKTRVELWQLYRVQALVVAPILISVYFGGWVLYSFLVVMALRGGWELLEMCKIATHGHRHPLFAFGSLLLILSLYSMGQMSKENTGIYLLLLVYVIVETSDSFALLTGKLLGRRHPFPSLSPKKTIEGLVGGMTVALLLTAGLSLVQDSMSLHHLLVLAVVTLLSGLAGDLLVSAYKRKHGRKDFKAIHILHGGVLDIYDSYLFAVPIVYLAAHYLGWFTG